MTSPVSNRQFLLGGTFSSFAAIVVVKALGFAESIAVARILGGFEFGLLALALSVTNVVGGLSALGIPSALTKFLSGEAASSQSAARATLRAALRIVLFSTAVVSLGSIPVTLYLLGPYYQIPEFVPLILVGILVIALSSPIVLFANALQGLRRVTRLNVISIIAAVVGLPLATVLALEWSTMGALVAFLSISILSGMLSLRAVRSALRTLPNGEIREGVSPRALLNYGFPTVLSGLIVLSASYFLNSLLAIGSGFVELGDFAVAGALAALIGFIPAAVGVPLVPVLSSLNVSDPIRGRAVVPRVMRVISFLSAPVVVLVILFAPEIVGVTYGPEYSGAPVLLSLLAIPTFLSGVSGVVGSQVTGSGRMWLGLGVNVVWTVTVAVSGALLVPTYGAIGACVTILLGYTALAVALVALGKGTLGLRFHGMAGPTAWSSLALSSAFLVAVFGGQFRLLAGVVVMIAVVVSGVLLLRPDERILARDALAFLVHRRRLA